MTKRKLHRSKSRLARFWRFITWVDPRIGESILSSIAAGLATVAVIALAFIYIAMLGAR